MPSPPVLCHLVNVQNIKNPCHSEPARCIICIQQENDSWSTVPLTFLQSRNVYCSAIEGVKLWEKTITNGETEHSCAFLVSLYLFSSSAHRSCRLQTQQKLLPFPKPVLGKESLTQDMGIKRGRRCRTPMLRHLSSYQSKQATLPRPLGAVLPTRSPSQELQILFTRHRPAVTVRHVRIAHLSER